MSICLTCKSIFPFYFLVALVFSDFNLKEELKYYNKAWCEIEKSLHSYLNY